MMTFRVEIVPYEAGSSPPASEGPEPRLWGAATRIDKHELQVQSVCFFCKWHYPPYAGNDKFDLAGAVLFVVLCSEALSQPASKKGKQLLEFTNHFKTAPGCLSKWIICAGSDVDATFAEFKQKFEEACPTAAPAVDGAQLVHAT
jgi:hypothetical protein